MSDLIADSLMIIFASAFNLLHVVLIEVYKGNPPSHRYTIGKEGNSLTAFSDNYSCCIIFVNLVVMGNLKPYRLTFHTLL